MDRKIFNAQPDPEWQSGRPGVELDVPWVEGIGDQEIFWRKLGHLKMHVPVADIEEGSEVISKTRQV
ncbi:hypothetical protein GUJ93_ZPchr0012g19897 [Zizania palustris]|uniref:Uncharacterized protein n=1 Tax=Zizania palustris TaxID=103762 RepID=A0A8J5WRI9_ZIZPA|nr:hypothetical protein GUJ93_ZPchr0012g19897 [Zizania palustris]